MDGSVTTGARRGWSRRSLLALAVSAVLLTGLLSACTGDGGPDCSGDIRLRMAASQDKVGLLQRAAADYTKSRTVDGKCVKVTVDSKNSGTAMLALARGWNERTDGPRPDIWSPASNVWGTLLRQRLQNSDRTSPVPEGLSPPIMTSPLTIAMPKPMAQALGWPGKAIGWADLAKLAVDPKGWAAYGHPEWGEFRLGKTNPNLSTSGLHATVGAYFAATGTTSDLTPADITNPKNRKFVADIEKSMVHYGATSLTFLSNMQRADDRGQAMSYISAVTVEEDSVWNYNQGNPTLDPAQLGKHPKPKVPLVAVYPKEGTISSDHPFIPLTWMDGTKKKAANDFLAYLHGAERQLEFQKHGYRDHQGNPGPLVTQENGLLRDGPKTKMELPSEGVIHDLLETWGELRKPAKVLIVIDRSGSMTDSVPGTGKNKGDLAKEAAAESLSEFRGQDKVGLWMFSARLRGDQDWQELVPISQMNDGLRGSLRARLSSLTLGGGTGLYNTAAASYDHLRAAREPGAINAVVFLTDGKNERPGGLDLETLLGRLSAGRDEQPVRLFTIGYGKDADQQVLRRIAQATEGESYDSSDPNTIRDVFTEVISNF